MDTVEIEIVDRPSDELADALTRLMPQLLGQPFSVTTDALDGLLRQPGTRLFVARLNGAVVGTAQLTVYERVYAPMAWVDGVVVDEAARGRGIAGTLMQAVLDAAREMGLRSVNLTSSPKREAANHLYAKLGFEQYETNYYRYKF